jgi:hypothetical protein
MIPDVKIIFYILGLNYWKLLEITFFFSPNIFLGVGKHGLLGRKI